MTLNPKQALINCSHRYENHKENIWTYPNILIEYKGSSSYITVSCEKHGISVRRYFNVMHAATPCSKCSKNAISEKNSNDVDSVSVKMINLHRGRFSYPFLQREYKNSLSKLTIICKVHGQFFQTFNNHYYGNSNCPSCSTNAKLKYTESINKCKEKHNNRYTYPPVQTNFNGATSHITVMCKKHGEFQQLYMHHVSGSNCPKCVGRGKLTIKDAKEKLLSMYSGRYTYPFLKDEFISSHSEITISCKKHGDFKLKYYCHAGGGSGCKLCSNNISNGELMWLNSLNIKEKHRQLKKLPGLEDKLWSYDGFDPKTNTVYEFLGSYWHGDPIKYKLHDRNATNKITFGELYKKTIVKEIAIRKAGYNYQFIWESDWNSLTSTDK